MYEELCNSAVKNFGNNIFEVKDISSRQEYLLSLINDGDLEIIINIVKRHNEVKVNNFISSLPSDCLAFCPVCTRKIPSCQGLANHVLSKHQQRYKID